ncbi:aminoglycoside phosphotransferase family protein [Candidatus Poribacteria bacterium]|nr:aminoglycoside phosphotransferase family protein [Candidatus Poribacteria bacterium]MBT5531936.1 aminoglycoside phosphotransferase family protein [Candidatus Poribacteria bacterium]MBT5712572.1 aminoglycoside phosphotransferase family protein [Candidatus Poribacteria bacterium]MBT7098865.1 aminoglycoside phosphotransferase family protein [Candidatus Poribacteria bacterium]MBT7804529.1 aminoglycoside phosphotransferase family protein [Candidatus Poribacteria bacterium]
MPPTSELDHCLAQIRQDMPELRAQSVRVANDGQYNDVVIVDDRLVCRFPKREAHIAAAEASVALLNRVYERLPLPVPRPTEVRLSGRPVGSAYVAYEVIAGEPFHCEVWDSVADDDVRRRIVRQLAEFLRSLHSVDLARVADLPLPDADAEAWGTMYASIRARLFEHMRPEARAEVADHFEALLAGLDFTPRLIHGDFGTSNLLYSPTGQRITGVIDFDGSGPGDPATDIAALMSYGDEFMALLVEEYPVSDAMLARARLYRGTFALQEALFGIEHGDTEALAAGIEEYR